MGWGIIKKWNYSCTRNICQNKCFSTDLKDSCIRTETSQMKESINKASITATPVFKQVCVVQMSCWNKVCVYRCIDRVRMAIGYQKQSWWVKFFCWHFIIINNVPFKSHINVVRVSHPATIPEASILVVVMQLGLCNQLKIGHLCIISKEVFAQRLDIKGGNPISRSSDKHISGVNKWRNIFSD